MIPSEAEVRAKEDKVILLTRQQMSDFVDFDDAYIAYKTLEKFNKKSLQKVLEVYQQYRDKNEFWARLKYEAYRD